MAFFLSADAKANGVVSYWQIVVNVTLLPLDCCNLRYSNQIFSQILHSLEKLAGDKHWSLFYRSNNYKEKVENE